MYIYTIKYFNNLYSPFFISKKISNNIDYSFSNFIIRIAIAAIALSLCIMIIASCLVNGFQKEIEKKIYGFWSHIHIQPYSIQKNISQKAVSIKLKPDLSQNNQVLHVQNNGSCGALIKTKNDFQGIILRGADSDFYWKEFKDFIIEGTPLYTKKDGESEPILISSNTAKLLNIKLHDKVILNFMSVPIKMKQCIVCGIYNSGLEEYDKQFAFVNMSIVQEQNGWGKDSVGGFEIFLNPSSIKNSKLKNYYMVLGSPFMSEEYYQSLLKNEIDIQVKNIGSTIKSADLEVVSIKELEPNIFDWLLMQSSTEVIILTIMFIVAILNLATALLILILERTNMIGILKSLGASNHFIRMIFMRQGAALILKGLFIGNIIGIGLCYIQKIYQPIHLSPESYYVSVAPVDIDFAWIIGLNLITFITCVISLLIPSLLISKITPIKSIRFK